MIGFDFVKDNWWLCWSKIEKVKGGGSQNSLFMSNWVAMGNGKEQVNAGRI